jgi:signal transduction histidine kinase
MTAPLPAAVRRLWPRRLRTRLAAFYSLLFLLAGVGLLAVAYALAAKFLLPTAVLSLKRLTPQERALLGLCKPLPSSQPLLTQCKHLIAVVGNGPAPRQDALAALQIAAVTAFGVLVVGAVALGWLAALRASEMRLGHRLSLAGPEDELKQLGDTFDLMLERLDAAFTSQQRFVANAAHELRTPLTAMRTAIEVTLAKPERTREQLEEMAERVRHSVQRAEATIEALLTLATSELGATAAETVDLATAAEDALDDARGAIDRRNLSVEASLEPAPTRGDRVLLERMIGNLVENAVRHNHSGGSIWIRTHRQNGSSVFEVANTGPQVGADQIPVLFEPFARAAQRIKSDDGVGLGLSIAEAIARAHDAEISARGRPEGGLELSVTLPS